MDKDKYAQVRLISKPQNMLKTIYTACRTCYSADSPLNIFDCDADKLVCVVIIIDPLCCIFLIILRQN